MGLALEKAEFGDRLVVETARLRLVAMDARLSQLEQDSPRDFFKSLGAQFEPAWPPQHDDQFDGQRARHSLSKDPSQCGWHGWVFLMALYPNAPFRAVGCGGFAGPPDAKGVAEIQYAMLPSFREQGLATEAVLGLTDWAFSQDGVYRIVAKTARHLDASRRVLEKAGFEDYPPLLGCDPKSKDVYYCLRKPDPAWA